MLIKKMQKDPTLVIILVVALVLRLFELDRFGFWGGEIHTMFHAARPLVEIPNAYREFTAHPPLWFVISNLLLDNGAEIWLLRLPAAIIGVAAVGSMYLFAERFFSRKWALVAAWLLAILPLSLQWSQAVRMYSAFLFFSIVSFIYTLDILDKSKKRAWIGFSVITLLNLYNHYFALFPLLVSGLYLSFAIIIPRFKKHLELDIPEDTNFVLRRLIYSAAAIFVAYFPWAVYVARFNFVDRQLSREASDAQSSLSGSSGYHLLEDVIGGIDVWFLWLVLLLITGGAIYLLRSQKNKYSTYFVFMMTLIPPIIIFLFSPRRFEGRYLLFLLPFLIVLILAGIKLILQLLERFILNSELRKKLSTIIVALLIAVISINYLIVDYYYFEGHELFFFETRSDPKNWQRRGDWKTFEQKIFSPALFMAGKRSMSSLRKQLATTVNASAKFQQAMFEIDWETTSDFDLWLIYPTSTGVNDYKVPNSACGIPVGKNMVTGPNQQFFRTKISVSSVQNLLSNGGFEMLDGASGGAARINPQKWKVRGPGAGLISNVSSPVYEGQNAISVAQENETGELRELSWMVGERIEVEPATLLITTAKVLDPILRFHSTNPTLSFAFYNDAGDLMVKDEYNHCPIFDAIIPHQDDELGKWQLIYLLSIVPEQARQVSVRIDFHENAVTNNPIVIDDVRMESIIWEVTE